MKPHRNGLIIAIVTFVAVLGGVTFVDGWLHSASSSTLAQPSLPARFFGTVTINGTNVPTDTILSASISQTVYATTVITFLNGVSSYVIDVPGDDPGTSTVDGGRDGDQVDFKIPGYTAVQTGSWQFGDIIELDLSMRPDPIPEPPARPITIPEPLTVILFGTGLVGMSTFRVLLKRKRC